MKKEVLAAGFVFVGASDLLRQPGDSHTVKIFDPSIRGRTDQFILKFQKPKEIGVPGDVKAVGSGAGR